jgi:5-hydroxyisourate hydrolase
MISTHILDTSLGKPAENVLINLEKKDSTNHQWVQIASGLTNQDGRVSFNSQPDKGIYRLTFGIEAYFSKNKINNTTDSLFFLDTSVVFQITDTNRKYHIPLLLNPYGYTTYRGS